MHAQKTALLYGILQLIICSISVGIIEHDIIRGALDETVRWAYICPSMSITAGLITIIAYCIENSKWIYGAAMVLNGAGLLCWSAALIIVILSWIISAEYTRSNIFYPFALIFITSEMIAGGLSDISLWDAYCERRKETDGLSKVTAAAPESEKPKSSAFA
ncbi:hypothetical protein DdX_18780 [Ditylenchus destructor]|uniref:Uncharacterized protein n=1 Tax=Ditylenchus destructor TaxID=166010 RepID=A0AAD4MNW7_9BILA|nr:hypothetical protein DdX_18780 [Ditylenchus destructor]